MRPPSPPASCPASMSSLPCALAPASPSNESNSRKEESRCSGFKLRRGGCLLQSRTCITRFLYRFSLDRDGSIRGTVSHIATVKAPLKSCMRSLDVIRKESHDLRTQQKVVITGCTDNFPISPTALATHTTINSTKRLTFRYARDDPAGPAAPTGAD